jgi:hypothetical protein
LFTDVSRLRPHLCTIIERSLAEENLGMKNKLASLLDTGHKSNLRRKLMRK